ncbi:MAG: tyrosine-type recombinase/integrase [Gammaproteobacteria bacterium]
MATFSQLPSGKWRVQVRRHGVYRASTFETKREARDWATQVEAQVQHVVVSGFAPIPKSATLADLIDKYIEIVDDRTYGRTKAATLAMLRRELGKVKLSALSAVVLRDFVDRRLEDGAGGVTVAADLSYLSAILKFGRHARRIDINDRLALDARAALKYRKVNTRGNERSREPTDAELERLYAYWQANKRQKIDMVTITRFALASGMRLGEICSITVEDVDREKKTVVIRDRKDPQKKHGNDQTVPLLPAAWSIVEPRIEGRTEGRIFPFDAKSASTAFTRACAELGIEDLHFHDTRHRAAREFFAMGLQIPQVALITGHKTWSMLKRYTDIKPGDVHAAVAAKVAA